MQEAHAEATAVTVSWDAVWEHALQEAKVATVLRMSLDNPQPSVVRAAAQALAVLVGPDPEVESIWQTADLNPVTCK